MGGSAYLLFGEVDPILLEKREEKPSLLQRLWGIKRFRGPSEMKMNDRLTIVEIKNPDLSVLIEEFKKHLWKTLPDPHSASKQFLDYLKRKTLTLYLRGNKSPEKTEWYIQFTFSGCAGMGETSAELGAHWIELWIDKEREAIAGMLEKTGFRMHSKREDGQDTRFVPFERFGYAKMINTAEIDADCVGSKYFEFDQAVLEGLSEKELSLMAEFDKEYKSYVESGRCYCQLCNPKCIPLKK